MMSFNGKYNDMLDLVVNRWNSIIIRYVILLFKGFEVESLLNFVLNSLMKKKVFYFLNKYCELDFVMFY